MGVGAWGGVRLGYGTTYIICLYIHIYIYTYIYTYVHISSNNPYINNSFNSENSDDDDDDDNNNNTQRHYDANDYNQYQLSQDTHVI